MIGSKETLAALWTHPLKCLLFWEARPGANTFVTNAEDRSNLAGYFRCKMLAAKQAGKVAGSETNNHQPRYSHAQLWGEILTSFPI